MPVLPNTFSDQEIQRRSQCSLYVAAEADPLLRPAMQTLRWGLRERHLGKIRTAADLRERFVQEWVGGWSGDPTGSAYWVGPNQARPFARRVYEFLLKYEVIHPYEAYTLELDHGQITGEMALVQWRRARRPPVLMVLDARLNRGSELLSRQPTMQGLTQWLAAREQVDDIELGIVHQPLLRGEAWLTREVNEALARRWLNAMVKEAADGSDYPRNGPQCKTCSRPCTEVFNGPDGHNWD
jgi:hypothetical protein